MGGRVFVNDSSTAGSTPPPARRLSRRLLWLIGVSALLVLVLLIWMAVRPAGDKPTRNPVAAPAPAGFAVNGIDVSSHDHPDDYALDWPARVAAGEDFAYVKATEGNSYVNPYFAEDYEDAKDAGLYVGAYVFARPDLGDPRSQARHFIDHMRWEVDGRTLPPLIDLEWPYFPGIDDCYGLAPVDLTQWIRDFIDEIEITIHVKPAIYTNVSWWNPCTGGSADFADHPLDIVSCEPAPPEAPGWGNNWTFWQYDIPECGRGAEVLADVFNGTPAELAAIASGPVT